MTTLRRRITFWYSVALVLSVFVFGTALYLERRASSLEELDRRLALEADFAVKWLTESQRVLGSVVVNTPRPALQTGIGAYFEAVRDYLVVSNQSGQVLFLSDDARHLSYAAIERLTRPLQGQPTERRVGTMSLDLKSASVRWLVVPVSGAGPDVGGLLVAAPLDTVSFGPGDLLRSMLVIAPIVLVFAGAFGYWLAGATLRPVQGIIDEVEAISDGRSLHRRVAVPVSGDEMTRLAVTVNGMLARLEQSFGSLHRFTADASHELKTPLMVLRAGVERALTHPSAPTETMQSLDEALEQINQMTEMVESLLTLARADEGRAPLTLERVDLRTLLADVAETAEMLGEQADVRVETETPGVPIEAAVDVQRIRELLLNLITNAIKYTHAGGTVTLVLSADGDDMRLVVRDTGIGIAPGDLHHIFERFWRADPARSRTGERAGVGLGLAITKWIAEAHGGSIAVQSRPGRGTTFTVTLPRSVPADVASGDAIA